MGIFTTTIRVRHNQKGFLFKDNVLMQELEPGVYEYFNLRSKLHLVEIPQTIRLIQVVNQEVLTHDNIALRFSFMVRYRISNGEKYLANFSLLDNVCNGLAELENLIRVQSQIYLRDMIATIESTSLTEKRAELTQQAVTQVDDKMQAVGVNLVEVSIIDFTFPKMIQDLFSKELEAKIRAKSELENARTTVATARMLKNAADMIKQNEEMKFVQTLEMITRIADKGKHTFHIGEMLPLPGNRKNQ